jgi:plastocyanin
MRPPRHRSLIATLVLITAACGGKQEAAKPAVAAAPATPTGVETPCATCKVIEVTMTSNEKGNFFTPNKIEAHAGDVLRFKVVVGVHNANFLPDSNAGKAGLPPASPLLQLPGQTWDVKLAFGKGNFYFQCDPHAALGMRGSVKVED